MSFIRGELPGGEESAEHDGELDGAAPPDDAVLLAGIGGEMDAPAFMAQAEPSASDQVEEPSARAPTFQNNLHPLSRPAGRRSPIARALLACLYDFSNACYKAVV